MIIIDDKDLKVLLPNAPDLVMIKCTIFGGVVVNTEDKFESKTILHRLLKFFQNLM